MPIRFGDFAVDLERRELRDRDGARHLTPKAFELLQILIEQRPRVIAQQELYDRLWPDTFVQQTNLHNLIGEVRTALRDRAKKIIRTNYGFGFSFAADAFIDSARGDPRMFVADRSFPLHDGENIVGRDASATVQIDAKSVSRLHARILIAADRATIEDLGSKNGTFLRGSRLHSIGALADGDEVTFGSVAATFRLLPAAETETID